MHYIILKLEVNLEYITILMTLFFQHVLFRSTSVPFQLQMFRIETAWKLPLCVFQYMSEIQAAAVQYYTHYFYTFF